MSAKSTITKLFDWVFDAWWLDWALVISLTLVAAAFVEDGSALDILYSIPGDARSGSYSDLLTVAALLAGFSSVAFTTYLGWNSRGIGRVRQHAGRKISRTWISLIAGPWIAALSIWVVRVVDRGDPPTNDSRWIVIGALLLVVLNVLRCLWVFTELLKTETSDSAPTQGSSGKTLRVRS